MAPTEAAVLQPFLSCRASTALQRRTRARSQEVEVAHHEEQPHASHAQLLLLAGVASDAEAHRDVRRLRAGDHLVDRARVAWMRMLSEKSGCAGLVVGSEGHRVNSRHREKLVDYADSGDILDLRHDENSVVGD
jgi:hypothetical protein